jgi:YfiR/HmsC-like
VTAGDEMKEALISLRQKVKVQELPIVVKSVPYKDAWPANDLAKVAVVYVSRGLESKLNEIRTQTTKNGIRTLCGDRDLAKQGLAIAAYVKGSSPGITINLPAARSAGMDLDTRLLAISEVLK